ncbi:MAG: right-handed parallel beta-helix repeat-containing protein, partial [Acidobacteriota bacterium]|nr:right-handed parallel beta-helix repeat-containing protein [Acidobacteriota bacterium]
GSSDGILLRGGSATLDGCTISDCSTGLNVEGDASPTVKNCVFSDSYAGASCDGAANVVFSGCTFSRNEYGANFGGSGTASLASCVFRANSAFAVANSTTHDIPAGDGDWGTADTTAIDRMIYDQQDDPACGRVLYLPIRTDNLPYSPPDFIRAWRQKTSAPTDLRMDVDGDGVVDHKDALLIVEGFLQSHR